MMTNRKLEEMIAAQSVELSQVSLDVLKTHKRVKDLERHLRTPTPAQTLQQTDLPNIEVRIISMKTTDQITRAEETTIVSDGTLRISIPVQMTWIIKEKWPATKLQQVLENAMTLALIEEYQKMLDEPDSPVSS